jgi:hypothetical protein
MPLSNNDYRLDSICPWMERKTWHYSQYKQPSPEWDHDHYIFCWQRLAEPAAGFSDAEFDGFTDDDDYHWMCKKRFGDLFEHLKERLKWKLRNNPTSKEDS